MEYQTMHFGKKKQRISLIHMNKPLKNGLIGMVSSRLFNENIPVIIDQAYDEQDDYDYACLASSKDGAVPRILMSREVYFDIKRGKPYARVILFHELGHYFHKDHLIYNEARNEERIRLSAEGYVSDEELKADSFAVEYLGGEIVASGLLYLRKLIECNYNGHDTSVVLKEIDMRRNVVLNSKNVSL